MLLRRYLNFINKRLTVGFFSAAGRNYSGKICIHHKANGNKTSYLVDFFRRLNSYGRIKKIVKIKVFSAFLGLVIYQNGLSSYILISDETDMRYNIFSGSLRPKDILIKIFFSGTLLLNVTDKSLISTALPLHYMPLHSKVNNIELYPFSGSILARAAGASTLLTTKLANKFIFFKIKIRMAIKIVVFLYLFFRYSFKYII